MNHEEFKHIYQKLIDIRKSFKNNIRITNVSLKDSSELVTNVDISIENILIPFLQSIDNIPCLSEETNTNINDNNYWVIDPIDGTTNFIHNYPSYCISIAKVENNITTFGIVYNLATGVCFYAIKDIGSYVIQNNNCEKINVSNTNNLKDSLLAFGCPYDKTKTEYLFKICNNLLKECRDLKRNGPASLDLCYVACGILDGYFEFDLKEWDYKAGALILKEAGGKITDFSGDLIKNKKSNVLATNMIIHDQIINTITNI